MFITFELHNSTDDCPLHTTVALQHIVSITSVLMSGSQQGTALTTVNDCDGGYLHLKLEHDEVTEQLAEALKLTIRDI